MDFVVFLFIDDLWRFELQEVDGTERIFNDLNCFLLKLLGGIDGTERIFNDENYNNPK